ncbi:MAG: hypothetical protein JKY14_13870, partial [Paraglaciecola sp.]|nr:hypothetical protein [Paraglaciecola sp.]
MIKKILKQLSILTALALMCLANVSIAAATKLDNQPTNTKSKPQVLLMMSSHASKPKGDLLQLLAKGQPFDLVNFSTKGKSDEDIKAAWSKADLIMLDGINPALSKYMFGKYQGYPKQFPKVPVISLADLHNTN